MAARKRSRAVPPPLGTAIVAAKLGPPRSRDALIDRARLLARGPLPRVVMVRAPAGYGKTSLLVQWHTALARQGVRCCWLTLDEDDNQPARLLLHLAATLSVAAAAAEREAALSRLIADLQLAPASVTAMLDRLPALEPPFAIFLDELEHLVAPESLALVRRLIERLPSGASVLLASRTLPKLGLARLRVANELREIDAAELRFAADETAAFLAHHGFALAPDDVSALLARTEGWAAALQLTSLAIRGRRDAPGFIRNLSGSDADLAGYLSEDVLGRQSETVQRFLLETSILRRLDAELCDAVTGGRRSRRLLARLESAGLFLTTLDEGGRWFRYHPLFAHFLQTELMQRSPRRVARLHRAAARWMARHSLPLDAVHHALAAGDFLLAASLMDGAAKELNRQGQFSTVVRWSRELPERALDAHPAIRAAAAWAHLFQREFGDAERHLARIDRLRRHRRLAARVEDDVAIVAPIMAGHRDRVAETLELSQREIGRLSSGDSFNRGALRDSLAYGLIAAGRFDEARAQLGEARLDHERSGSRLGSVYTLALAGVVEAIEGKLSRAAELYGEAERLAGNTEDGGSSPLAAIPLGYSAELLYERDRLDEARARVDRHLDLAAESAVVDMVICAYLAAARVRFACGERDEAQQTLAGAELTGLRRTWPRLVAAVRWERVRFALRAGRVSEARRLRARISADLVAAEERPLRPHAGETEAQEIGELRLRLRSGQAPRALPVLRAARREANAAGRVWRWLRLRILEAEALDALGDRPAALRALREALRHGAAERFVRSFADEGPPITRLVRAIRDQDGGGDAAPREYLDAILRAAGEAPDPPSMRAPPTLSGALSRREREIVTLLAEGLSNREMARRLFVSENTVKFHLKTIFEKLGAANRVAAVGLARRAGAVGGENYPIG